MINCQYCKTDKSSDRFYKSTIHKGGEVGSCKDCVRARATANRNENIEARREFDRQRANNPNRVQARKDYQQTERGQKKARVAKRAYAERNPLIRQAHNAINNAVRDGRLHKPSQCESCSNETKLHGHHSDYNKPMDVMWLCDPCHKQWHRNNTPIYCEQLEAS